MQKIVIQYQAETEVVKSNLRMAGVGQLEADKYIQIITDADPQRKAQRNIYIKRIADILRSRACALQIWYIHELLSKITGLAPAYVARIAYNPEPNKIIKTQI